MTNKIVWNIANANVEIAHQHPLRKNEFSMPGGTTDVPPPEFDRTTHNCSFNGTEWEISELPPIPEPEIMPAPPIEEEDLEEVERNLPPNSVPLIQQLRVERNYKLQQCDWEIVRGLEDGTDITAIKQYRTELRELPQKIEQGILPDLIADEKNNLIFNDWPEKP